MTKEETIQVLRSAKERLFERGWIQHSLGLPQGPNCVVGSIVNETLTHSGQQAGFDAIGDVIGGDVQDPWRGIDQWNDRPTTSFNDVIDVIDLAIKNLEGA